MNPTCPGCIMLHGVMKRTPSWTFFQKNVYRKGCPSATIKAPPQRPWLSTFSPNTQQAGACRQPWLSPVLPWDALYHLSCVLLHVWEQCQHEGALKDKSKKAPCNNFHSISLLRSAGKRSAELPIENSRKLEGRLRIAAWLQTTV